MTVLWRRRRSKVHSSLIFVPFCIIYRIFSFPGNWVQGLKIILIIIIVMSGFSSQFAVSRPISRVKGGSAAEWLACWTHSQKARVQIAVATLSGNSLRRTVHTHCASVHQAAKLVAALLRVAGVTAGLVESNGSLPLDLWLTSPASDCQEPGSAPEPYAR